MRRARVLARSFGPALIALLVATAIRSPDFGNPVIHVDEQWYLLVGDRVLRGAVLYVDLWDRKPVGLFLLFAAMRLLPGDGVLAYQLVATLSAGATAIVVGRGARIVGATNRAALAAGLLYLLGLELLGGRGGQAPVFYNLPVAMAGLLVLRLPGQRRIVRSGAIACLLAGVAIQLKGTVAVEGAFFGLAHVFASKRQSARPSRLLVTTALWALLGLAPTLVVAGWYERHGLLNLWWFANVNSIALRPGYPPGQLAMRLLGIVALLSPLIACAVLTWRERPRAAAAAETTTLAFAWLVAATAGFMSIGTFFDHYALPLLVPLCICAAPALARSARVAVVTLSLALLAVATERLTMRDDRPGERAVATVVRNNARGGCPYVFAGDPVTYLLADVCTPTAYAFPNLLAYTTEQGATGIDEAAEVRRILARRPPVIVGTTRRLAIWNAGSLRAVRRALRDYRPVFSTPRAGWRTVVWLRRDLAYRAP